jgi:hypothetical protein
MQIEKSLSFKQQQKSPILHWGLWLLLLTGIAVIKFFFHELWKDEWQAWLMARDMPWDTLIQSLYYEGHPALWYLYLKVWTLIAGGLGMADDLALSLSHLLIVAIALYWFIHRLDLVWWLKLLLLLGYYPFFEYGVVNRGYAFVMLLTWMLADTLREPEGRAGALAFILFFLCQTEVYGVMIAGAAVFYIWWKRGKMAAFGAPDFRRILSGAGLGLLVFFITVYPRASQEELSSAYNAEPLAGETIARAIQGNLANTYWLGSIPDTNVEGVSALGITFSGVVLLALLFFFWRSKSLFWTFVVFQSGFIVFSIFFYVGGVRQWGTSILFFIFLLQLWTYEDQQWRWPRWLVLASIILFQLYYTARALNYEIRYPFSHAKATAAFIDEKVPEDVPLVAINKFQATPVVGYLGRPVYALPEGEPFTYFKWVQKIYLPSEAELLLFAEFKGVGGIVILTPQPLDEARYPKARQWRSFQSFDIKNEKYYLYTLAR